MEGFHLWWQRGVIYQIYPRSFADSSGDGVGDLAGIREKLDYLQWLGVTAVWLSPIFPSPMADFGYDVSDYTAIHPLFGTLEEFDALVFDMHERGMRIILDFVPNHTSIEHAWFKESRSSRDNPKRDWYLWRDPAPDGGPPNNWKSAFGGPGWELDETTGQYYYHAFLKDQPDLNWRNPEVVAAMLDSLRFWLDRGVDGFRVDVIWHIIKDDQFRDNPPNPDYRPGDQTYHEFLPLYTVDRPEVHGVISAMRKVLDEYQERMMVGEIYLPTEKLVEYYGIEDSGGMRSGVHLPYNFQLLHLPWNARAISAAINTYEALLPANAWPNWVLGNHDSHRVVSRIGAAQARVAAMMLLTLRGTPTVYYGEELGMHDVEIPPERIQDPFEKNVPGKGLGRDPERTPMQWSPGLNAGFTTGSPWLPLPEDASVINVELEKNNPGSMLMLHRRLIALRNLEPALAIGDYAPMDADGDVIAYVRRHGDRRFLVVLNLGENDAIFDPHAELTGRILIATRAEREGESLGRVIKLDPAEGLLIELS